MNLSPPQSAALDPQIAALIAQAAKRRTPHFRDVSPAEARTLYEKQAPIVDIKPVPLPRVDDLHLPLASFGGGASVPARLYYGAEPNPWLPQPVLLFFHGGGFTVGSIHTHDRICRWLAAHVPCAVLSVDYRLAPEHPFPAAVHDAWAALRWLEVHGAGHALDTGRIAVGGDSAGGTLAAVTAIHARDLGLALALQLLIYPGTGGHQNTPSHRRLTHGVLLDRADIDWFFGHYLRSPTDRNDWRFAPLDAPNAPPLAGVAPAWVLTAGFDPLCDEGRLYAEKLQAQGVAAQWVDFPDMVHGFFNMGGWVDRARVAHQLAAAALREAFGLADDAALVGSV